MPIWEEGGGGGGGVGGVGLELDERQKLTA